MKAFGRRIEFEIGGRTLIFPELKITFKIDFDTDSDGNTGTVTFYNLSEPSVKAMEKGANFVLKAGYKEDIGTILPGIINKNKSIWNGTDKVTKLFVSDNADQWVATKINKTWRRNIKASEIIKDIVNILPYHIGRIAPASDTRYPKGKIFSCTCREALEELAADTGSKLHISRNSIYIYPPDEGKVEVVNLNQDTGLIRTPERIEQDSDKKMYKVTSLLNYRLGADSLIRLKSRNIDGIYRVKAGKHDGNKFNTELEVEKYAG